MKAFVGLVGLGGLAALLSVCGVAFAAPSDHLNWGSQINQSQCAPNGTVVINVTQKVTNDVDSGNCGNYWAYDNEVRQIQVVQTGADTFCATVSYQGSFSTIAGKSPGGSNNCSSSALGTGVTGTFQGGYIAKSFTGTLISKPLGQHQGQHRNLRLRMRRLRQLLELR
jgi:hypothetical protein